MNSVHILSTDQDFPSVDCALSDPDGLLAMGADLSLQRLITAYRNGIFPWFEREQPILWWSPGIRAGVTPQAIHISRSMAKFIRRTPLQVTVNHAFERVIHACSHRQTGEGTWITPEMEQAYIQLHRAGYAHSIEVWNQEQLVGGLYGVGVGNIFCGESMFHRQTNASKLAFIQLAQHFAKYGGQLIDAQMPTQHLMSLGVTEMLRSDFIHLLQTHRDQTLPAECWKPQRLF